MLSDDTSRDPSPRSSRRNTESRGHEIPFPSAERIRRVVEIPPFYESLK